MISDEEKASFKWGGTRARPRKKIERVMKKGETYLKPPGSCLTKWPDLGVGVDVECCEECNIYVLDACEQVQISECVKCRIVIGPCVGSVMIFDCIDCTVSLASKQTRLRDCTGCELRCYAPTYECIVIETSKSLKFGCWDVAYPGLASQFVKAAALEWSATTNHWDRIFDFSPPEGKGNLNWSKLPLLDPQGRWCELAEITPEGVSGGSLKEVRSDAPTVEGCENPIPAADGVEYSAAWFDPKAAAAERAVVAEAAAEAREEKEAAAKKKAAPAAKAAASGGGVDASGIALGGVDGEGSGGSGGLKRVMSWLGGLFKKVLGGGGKAKEAYGSGVDGGGAAAAGGGKETQVCNVS